MIKSIIFVFLFTLLSSAQKFAVRGEFNDQHLDVVLTESELQKTAGLIYAWSPRMPLSILGVKEIAIIAKNLNLPLYVILDPTASDQEVRDTAKNYPLLYQSRVLVSEKLISMSMKIHYPSLIIYKNGELLTPSRPGYDEPERLEAYIIRRLK